MPPLSQNFCLFGESPQDVSSMLKNRLQFVDDPGFFVIGNCHSATALCANPSARGPSLPLAWPVPGAELLGQGGLPELWGRVCAELIGILVMCLVDLGLQCCPEWSASDITQGDAPGVRSSPSWSSSTAKMHLGLCPPAKHPWVCVSCEPSSRNATLLAEVGKTASPRPMWFFTFWVPEPLWASKLPGFPGGSDGKESTCNAGHLGPIPGSGRSPGEGHGNPLQYSCLGNLMARGAWWASKPLLQTAPKLLALASPSLGDQTLLNLLPSLFSPCVPSLFLPLLPQHPSLIH